MSEPGCKSISLSELVDPAGEAVTIVSPDGTLMGSAPDEIKPMWFCSTMLAGVKNDMPARTGDLLLVAESEHSILVEGA